MEKLKIKNLEEVKKQQDKTLSEIKRDFKIMTVLIIIFTILGLIICFKAMSLAIDYEALNKEKQTLEDLTEMQSKEIERLRYEQK